MLSLQNIEGLHHEDFTFVDAYRKRIEFKLAYNFQSSTARLNTGPMLVGFFTDR